MASWELALGAALKQHRRAARMTQEALAERANYSASYISQIERGEKAPTLATIDLLAFALELDTEQTAALRQRMRQGRAQTQRQPFIPPPAPIPLTSLIGREALLADLRREAMLPAHRLLTLVGPAGVGKTRLALELGRRFQQSGELAVVFIPLDTVSDPAMVVPTIARAFDAQIRDGDPLASVSAALAACGPLLMTLDNFEHVIAAAPAISSLLRACPTVRVLATSRVPLSLQGEYTVAVPALAVPPKMDAPQPDEIVRVSSVALLIERMVAVNHAFAPTPEDILTLSDIAHRLDGLPLALELVAARSALLTPHELLLRLTTGSIFHTLATGARDLPDRQRTLYSALRWSYDLLDPLAQRLFRGLSVLAGGTLLAAHAIALPASSDERFLDVMSALVASNLVAIESGPGSADAAPGNSNDADRSNTGVGERRFSLLHTMRDFGLRCLKEQREERALRQRHAEYFVAWGERMGQASQQGGDGALGAIEREIENVRAALRWLQETAQAHAGQRLATALGYFWDVRGYWREGLMWLLTFAPWGAEGSAEDQRARSKTLRYASVLAYDMSELDHATALANEALKCAADDPALQAGAYNALATIAFARGDAHLAYQYDVQQLALYRQVGEKGSIVRALNNVASDLTSLERLQESIALYEEAIALARRLGDADRESISLSNLCMPLCALGYYERARGVGQAALAIIQRIGAPSRLAHCLTNLGDIEFRALELDAAWSYFNRSLDVYRQLGESSGVAITYYNLSCVALAREDPQLTLELCDQARLYYDPADAKRLDTLVLTGMADALSSLHRDLSKRYLRDGLAVAKEIDAHSEYVEGAETLAVLLATDDRIERQEHAAQLLGAIHSERETRRITYNEWTRRKVERVSADLIAALGQERYAELFALGAAQSLPTLVSLHLDQR